MKKTLLLKTMLLLCALVAGSLNGWAEVGAVLAQLSGTGGNGYATRQTKTDNYNVSWVLSGSSSGTWGSNSNQKANVKPTAADLPVVKGVTSDATTSTQYHYFYYATTSVSNVGSVEFTFTGTYEATTNCNVYIVMGDDVSTSGGDAYTQVELANTSSTKQGASISSGGTYTFTFAATQTSAKYYGLVIKVANNSYKRFASASLTLKEGSVQVNSLSVKTAPTKTRYEVGENLDMSGLVLTADGEDVSTGYIMSIDGSAITNGATLSSAGKKTITIAYGGKEVTQIISVGDVTGIAVTTPPTKTSYDTGDSFDPTGMVVTAYLSTGEETDPDTWTKEVTGYTIDPEDNLIPDNTSVTITYKGKTTTQAITVTDVAVTGVSLKESTTIEKEKTETLTPNIQPSNATNKSVTWKSDNTAVATVSDDGVVTGVNVGTANITVTTSDGGYEATCAVTVVNQKGSKDAPFTVADVIKGDASGKNNIWVKGFIVGSWNNSGFSSSSLVNTNLALSDTYNGTETIPVELSSNSGLRTNWGPASNSYKVGVAQVLIKGNGQDYFSTSAIKGTSEIETVAEAITVSNAGYATWSSDNGLDFTGFDVKAYKATVNGIDITFDKVTEVPANEGVLLQNEGTFVVPVKSVAAWAEADNAFVRGEGNAVATGDGPYNYILNKVNDVVGFYKANGQTVAKNRAYLQTGTAAARILISLDEEGNTTGIEELQNANNEELKSYYNLNGQRVVNPTKGLYIVNGKKVIVK